VAFKGDSISKDQIQMLNQVSDRITYLKISDCYLSDDLITEIANIKHLTRIDLSKNNLNVKMVSFLMNHKHLESSNLNDTNIDNESLRRLLDKSSSLRIYIRNTKITSEQISNLAQSYPNAEIISEFKFEKVVEAKSVFAQEVAQ
jgi:hypothetical protein